VAATGTRTTATWHRWTRTSAASAVARPTATATTASAPSRPVPWRNGPNDWRPAHIHFSISGPSIATKLITQLYFEGDPLIPMCPIVKSIANPEAVQQLIARLDMSMANPMDCLAYRFDIVLRGQRKTHFENR
jgi:protocatechuate 3,4-dioxygenase beta subunit